MTIGELTYMCLDLAKATTSDDSYLVEDHVISLLKHYRSFLIKKEQEKEKSSTDIASEFEYQQVCLGLEKVAALGDTACPGGYYLRSTAKLPKILEGTLPRVYPLDYYQSINVTFVPREKMRYVGTNPYLQSIIYVSVGPDMHLYFKSTNPQFLYLQKVRMSAVFEDFDEATELLCNDDGSSAVCDVMDAEFPIRDYLVPALIELVVKELTGNKYQPIDKANNASDDISEISVKN